MTTPLAKVFSTIDSVKRVLGSALSDPLEFMKASGASAAASPMTAEQALEVTGLAPAGITLFHGGPAAVTKVLQGFEQNNAKGPGFYLSNILNVPLNFATSGGKNSGVISAFDFPDSEYAKMLALNTKSLEKQPAITPKIAQLLQDVPAFKDAMKSRIREARNAEYPLPAEQVLHGEWIDQALNNIFGTAKATEVMAAAGIPGKKWQYTAERPAEITSVVFPDYYKQLSPIAQLPVDPGIEGARAANVAMKAILGKTK